MNTAPENKNCGMCAPKMAAMHDAEGRAAATVTEVLAFAASHGLDAAGVRALLA